MSTQVAFVPSRTRMGAATKPVSTITSTPSSSKALKLSRLRAPPKPEIEVDKALLKKQLTPMQYKVTQEKFTERAFSGEYLRLNDEGKYCCVVCGEQLFSSETKYDSGCGWPAFSNVIDNKKVICQADLSHVGGNLLLLALNQDLARTEVTCAKCGAHLGHVFDDGPKPSGKRYCVNSVSLRFKKKDELSCDGNQSPDLTPKCTLSEAPKLTEQKAEPVRPSQTDINQIRKSFISEATGNVTSCKVLNKEKGNTPDKLVSGSKLNQTKPDEAIWRPRLSFGTNKTASQQKGVASVEPVVGPSDANNNRIGPNKYSSVKSRYLDHLNSIGKQTVFKYTTKKNLSSSKPFLETHL